MEDGTSMPPRGDVGTSEPAPGVEWAVGIATATLLLVSVGSYLYHRDRLAVFTKEHLRLRVCAPPSLGAGRPAKFHILTTEFSGEPVRAQVEIALLGPDGTPILRHTDQAAADGLLRIVFAGKDNLPEQGVQLEVTASRSGSRKTFRTQLAAEPVRYLTRLATDRPSYRPGDTVFYRSATLRQLTLTEAPDLFVQFKLHAADGNILQESAYQTTTSRGVGSGALAIPADVSPGCYTLVGRSPERLFPVARLPVSVNNRGASTTASEPPASGNSGIRVTFYPEGGYLVSNVENRVYFTAVNSRGEPVDLKGLVIDADNAAKAMVETIHSGMGAFSIRPLPQGHYRLRIADPPDSETEPELPEPHPDRNVAMSAGVGVFDAGKPLELNLRAVRDGVPLVVTAWCQGSLVGYEPIVTRVLTDDEPREGIPGAGGVNQVTLMIPDDISGPVRLTAYDYSGSPPMPIAQRWVYRRPLKRLNIQAVADIRRFPLGNQAAVDLTVTDESGNPVPAVLAVSAVDKMVARSAGDQTPPLPADFLYGIGMGSFMPHGSASLDALDDAETDVALGLLLGTHGERSEDTTEEPGANPSQAIHAPPIVLDNLQPLRQEFQQALEQYRRDRTRALNLLTTLSFFGGLGLVLAVAMLGLFGVVSGLRFWLPAVGTATCCLFIGAILFVPPRSSAHPQTGTAFVSFDGFPPQQEAASEEYVARRPDTVSPTVVRYAYEADRSEPVDWGKWSGTLFWNPLLLVGEDGRAEIYFDLPYSTQGFHLRVEAHGGGRLGAVHTCTGNADHVH